MAMPRAKPVGSRRIAQVNALGVKWWWGATRGDQIGMFGPLNDHII